MAGPQDRQSSLLPTPYALTRLTFREVEREIARLPAVVLPCGGCEQHGELGALGVASVCAEAIAAAFSAKSRMLMAPTVTYGCSTPYSAFGGSAGVKSRTLTNVLCETIRMWYLQGITLVVAIDSLAGNSEAWDVALRRLKNTEGELTVVLFSLQRDERVRAFIGKRIQGKEPGRTEFGLLSMAAYIDPALVHATDGSAPGVTTPRVEQFVAWRKKARTRNSSASFFRPGPVRPLDFDTTPISVENCSDIFYNYLMLTLHRTGERPIYKIRSASRRYVRLKPIEILHAS